MRPPPASILSPFAIAGPRAEPIRLRTLVGLRWVAVAGQLAAVAAAWVIGLAAVPRLGAYGAALAGGLDLGDGRGLGGLFVLFVFAMVLSWGLSVARRSQDRFAKLLAGGMTATIFFYVAINLMMVMGLAPVVGIPLPVMSHGGSSMMTNMICIGTLMMVNNWNRRAPRGGWAASA